MFNNWQMFRHRVIRFYALLEKQILSRVWKMSDPSF